jgi:hypothetical protein
MKHGTGRKLEESEKEETTYFKILIREWHIVTD